MDSGNETELGKAQSQTLEFGGVINEQETEKRNDRKIAQDLTTLFNMLDRLITMLRVYPQGHYLIDEFAEQVRERFARTFETSADMIQVKVGALELETDLGTVFFSKDLAERNEYVWYTPYSDGIIVLTFLEGMTADEIVRFMRVIDRVNQGSIGSDDDSVTLLWELGLEFIEYVAVEGFVEGAGVETFDNLPEPEVIAMVADAAINPDGEQALTLTRMFDNLSLPHVDLFTRMQIMANSKTITSELKDADLAYAFGVREETITTLNHEWTAGADLEYRLIEALLSIVRTAPVSESGVRAAQLIKTVTNQLLMVGSYGQAARVLELLQDRRELFTNSDIDPLGDLVEELSDPLQLEALLHVMQKSTKERESISRLLLLLGVNAVQLQILRLLSDPKRKIVALMQLVDVLISATRPENQSMLVKKEFVESEAYLRRLLPELANRDLSEFKVLPRLIRAGLAHESLDVKTIALSIDSPVVWQDSSIAEQYLTPLSKDLDPSLRKKALERLGEYHPERFRASIHDSLLARNFKGRTHAELRFLMRIFLESGDEAVVFLRSLLDTYGWFKSKREFAKMAAAVLLEAEDPPTLELVKKRAASFLVHPQLRGSYKQTLGRFGVAKQLPAAPPVDLNDPNIHSPEDSEANVDAPFLGGPDV